VPPRRASIDPVRHEKRIPNRTPESRAFAERVRVVMELTSRLNVLPFDDLDGRRTLLAQIFGGPVPESLSILPPFYCDHGLGTSFGDRVFINQGCYLLDLGGVTIGDRVLIGPRVTLSTGGHPVELHERTDRHRARRVDRCRGHGHARRHHRSRLGHRCRCRGRQGRPPAERRHRYQHRRAQAPPSRVAGHVPVRRAGRKAAGSAGLAASGTRGDTGRNRSVATMGTEL
jgi:acetyltransferase-like isoleucine patch superfamily enzyme